MKLWKIDLFWHGENVAVRSGIILAPTQGDAAHLAALALGSSYADYANVDVSEISDITSLPSGALYLTQARA
ncbi:hypothetical protein [Sphingopyxis terrae]|uniref:hypothetical protein n=1 Tax=Sphingopyxis terrae TaxID=33052 RepID=UPI000AAA48A8|nr:hypothetical protein [Sphingopyxis terrae]